MDSIKNKKIILTGGSGLLGRELVCKILENQASPIVLDINIESNQKLKKFIKRKYNKNIEVFDLDITNETAVIKIFNKIKKKYKTLDALINNADFNPSINEQSKYWKNLRETNLKDFKFSLDISLSGSFLMVKYFGELISQNTKGGSIINISSDLGVISPDHRIYNNGKVIKKFKPIYYSISKHGMIGLTKYLATYNDFNNVRSNVICSSGIFNSTKNIDKKFIEKLKKTIPLNRLANSDDFNSTVMWLLSDSASFVNGAVIMLDGGRSSW